MLRCLSAASRRVRLATPVEGRNTEFMSGLGTVLASVKVGDRWRVQIAWPSGTTKYFGKFGSEQEASGWISRHRWLTEPGMEGAKRPWGSVSGRKNVADVATEQVDVGEPGSERQAKD
jgi:hypothetical protein